ncbi:MAG: cell envelope integrity protein CreD [Barnesiella sp.]|nr:cell envelope integrity protein CreD [Barnesiella sp.]
MNSSTPPPVPENYRNALTNQADQTFAANEPEQEHRSLAYVDEIETKDPASRYSLSSLFCQFLVLLAMSAIVAFIAYQIDILAYNRWETKLLNQDALQTISSDNSYSFAISIITLCTFMLMDIRFRRPINNMQYLLISSAIACCYLLTLAFSEHLPFNGAYGISSLMTLLLLAVYSKSLMQNMRASVITSLVMLCEYGILFGLLNIGQFALLAGSLILFAIIGMAMYFTQKMRMVDGELFFK